MIVSWKWLADYVNLDMTHDELVDKLTMSGLNYEGTEHIGDDQAIDLEVTSNRPDCLGHLGVAREVAVLYERELNIPSPEPKTNDENIKDICQVDIECPSLCYRYTARLLKGVKVGPSPNWLVKRLEAIGQQSVNNVVDVTNYVMFECGQPLHAFDFGKVKDGRIVVREPKKNESIKAIDHKDYALQPGMCVIADAEEPVAIGGVMGGAESEISDSTTEILIEAAYFNQMSVRNTARSLNLHSPSSFRFERNIDSHGLDWASKRCCQLILETGGGELVGGCVDVGEAPATPDEVTLRFGQLSRVLGIEIPTEFSKKTLHELGLEILSSDDVSVTCRPPTWRKDLTREIDLIEEVGRIYGFDQVPDNAPVPMAASYKTKSDRVIEKVRSVMTVAGFDEAMTASLVPEIWSNAFSPWSDGQPLISSQPMLGVLEKASQNIGAVEFVRRSLVPSLLEARRINEYRSNDRIDIFETAKVYLPSGDTEIPYQPTLVAFCTGRDFYHAKGIVESLVETLDPSITVELSTFDHPLFDVNQSGELTIHGNRLGFIGVVSEQGMKDFGLRNQACVVELSIDALEKLAILIPIHQNQSLYPSVSRDFNLIMNNEVRWSQIENTVRQSGGDLLESVKYLETFRNEKKDGEGKKRVLLSVTLRSPTETLTGEQAESISGKIIADCESQHGATLLA
ncbi:MAG: phenylalanine--tRNA ligase subunit beta [Planctomycetota bacterium]